MSSSLQDDLVHASHRLYSTLPAHGKPVIRSNGTPEWSILATTCIVVPSTTETSGNSHRIVPVSLGTGVKCLPYSKLSEYGDTLHDCHAEILARRGFIRWLIWQAGLYNKFTKGEIAKEEESFLDRINGKFRLKDGITTWLYTSMLPCGDASTLYTSAHQSAEEALQWSETDLVATATPPSDNTGVSRGRSGYTSTSTLRTKPGRPDSMPSISMSCSDKIASWSVLGIQGGLLANLFEPIYLKGIVVGGVDTPEAKDDLEWKAHIKNEMERSIWGRLQTIQDSLPYPYILNRPSIHVSSVPFQHSKTSIVSNSWDNALEPAPSPLSISHLPFIPPPNPKKGIKPEIIADGGILGNPWKKGVLMKEKGRSRICKFAILQAYEKLLNEIKEYYEEEPIKNAQSYHEYKHHPGSAYQKAKEILRGTPKRGYTMKGLEMYDNLLSTGIVENTSLDKPVDSGIPLPPLKGWLVSGKNFESFTSFGRIIQEG
ncbi:uncharacterized protein L201_006857 [Kwoniella dendrophila CBS 6074]|uniref:A to I editase domain-containing protein n=1 Tax=Kwoniella dendrophila CBS 6074 TaxID=1295534 RepID=A0AAX4K2U0_9TREE